MSKMATALLEVVRNMDPIEARLFLEAAEDAVERTRMSLHTHGEGSPRDAAVQHYAGMYLRLHRDPSFRGVWYRTLQNDTTTFEMLGQEAGVSRERARQLYAQLCPQEYELDKRLTA